MTEWNDLPEERPGKGDFDPYEGCLDALAAWKNFGGLSRAEAYAKFCEMPEVHYEAFLWMGGVAFDFYYPVVERYILESRVSDNNDVEAIWVLAFCLKKQVEVFPSQHLRDPFLELVSHVRSHLEQYSVDEDEQGRIDSAWYELECAVKQPPWFAF